VASAVLLGEGEAFGIRAAVKAWLCGPVNKAKPEAASPKRAAKPAAGKPTGARTTTSALIKQLTAGFDLHANIDGQYFPVYHRGRRIGQVQLWNPMTDSG
jgi:hypothetical protein